MKVGVNDKIMNEMWKELGQTHRLNMMKEVFGNRLTKEMKKFIQYSWDYGSLQYPELSIAIKNKGYIVILPSSSNVIKNT